MADADWAQEDGWSVYGEGAPEPPPPVEDHVGRMTAFVQEHKVVLSQIEEGISESICKVWSTGNDPIGIDVQPPENVLVADLVSTSNDLFDKIITVFGQLCDEINELKAIAESQFYPAMAVYGESTREEKEGSEETNCAFMGRSLVTFQDIANFVDRCHAVCMNLVHQLAALLQGYYKNTFMHVNLVRVYASFATLLEILITLDAIVADNECIARGAVSFRKLQDLVNTDPARYGLATDDKNIKRFGSLTYHLNEYIFGGEMFSHCIEQDFEVPEMEEGGAPLVNVRHNKVFLEAFFQGIKNAFDRHMSVVTTQTETSERRKLVGIFGLYALYRRLVPARQRVNEPFYRQLWASQKKLPLIILYGKSVWLADQFLIKHVDTPPIKSLRPRDVTAHRSSYVKGLGVSFTRDMHILNLQTATWLVRFEEVMELGIDGVTVRHMRVRCKLMIEGLRLAHGISNLVTSFLGTHMALEVGMSKRHIAPVCRAVEALKGIECMFKRKIEVITQSMPHIFRTQTIPILEGLAPLKRRLASGKQSDITLDLLAAIRVIEASFHSTDSMSFTRAMLVSLCFDLLNIKGTLRTKEVNALRLCVLNIETLQDWQDKLSRACDCGFLYWNQNLLALFLDAVYMRPPQAHRLYQIMAAFQDPVQLLAAACHVNDVKDLQTLYTRNLRETFQNHIVQPLCRHIDSDLRRFVMSVTLDQTSLAPNPKTNRKVQHGRLLALKPIRIAGDLVDVKECVTRYLDSQFYNLTTVGLHNWKLYGEMKNLAQEIYGLEPSPSYLPMGTLDAGLDVLQIMRNIDIFVARYKYNINEQCFVERAPDKGARYLNTINTHSIANSMRTHGTGIVNTTVNFTYQFLQQKFRIFTQFMMDEYIKSNAHIQIRWFNKHKQELDNQYTYGRAMEFSEEIKKLGVTEEGHTFIDKFRLLITEIGNAMGFVRMVRSAGLHYCANAIKFVPDVRRIPKFAKWLAAGAVSDGEDDDEDEDEDEEEDDEDEFGDGSRQGKGKKEPLPKEGAGMSATTVEAARTLDEVLLTLSENFSEGTDYLQLLVPPIQKVLDTEKNPALKSFHVIVPSLIINFVERIRMAKDQLEKMRARVMRKDAYFTDDGFAIGLAYILTILKQNTTFDSLHWFHAMTAKLKKDAADLLKLKQTAEAEAKQRGRRTNPNEQAVQEIAFKEKRLKQNKRETELFFFSFSGARIFFKENTESPS